MPTPAVVALAAADAMPDTTEALNRSHTKQRLVVFSDDWGRHPSSCQHLIRHLLDDCDITWVNTIGTRRPSLSLATCLRGWEKVRQWRPGRGSPPAAQKAPRVLNPLMWPSFRGRLQRRVNCHLLTRFLSRHIPRLEHCVGLTTIPIVADLVDHLPVRNWVYYCVDDFSQWPGLDSSTLATMELKLIAKVQHIVAVSEVLQARMTELGREAPLLTHGVDLNHWKQDGSAESLPALASLERPLVLFWGLVDRRLDVEFLEALGRRLDRGSIVLIGPAQDVDPRLATVPRLQRLGPLDYGQLPAAAAAASVLIMPYADLPVTRAMQPLKLKEYLATGKPVVARSLPAVRPWSDALDAVDNSETFVSAVLTRIAEGMPQNQHNARIRLNAEDWSSKAQMLKDILFR